MALKELREDHSRVVHTVHKRVAMVVLDKQDYNNKAPDKFIMGDPINQTQKQSYPNTQDY